jgi:hypothetical protein
MKLDAPANSNYAATVVRLPKLLPLEGCDFLQGAPLYGFQAIISLDHQVDELGIVFPAETQLSEDFCKENDLYRHSEQNKNPDAKGYLEDNRRVRAIKLRGHRSDCLFLGLDSLAYTGAKLTELKEGDTFDTINGVEICKKYVIKTRGSGRHQRPQEKKFVRVDPKVFPEHPDSDNWFRWGHLIPDDQHVYVTQKVHGTSIRLGRVPVLRKLTLRDKIAKRIGVKVQETEYDALAGSRKVVKDPNHPDYAKSNHFYDEDIWANFLPRVEHLIPENFLVFGELIGHTSNGAAIQQNYTYEQKPGTHDLFVYRVATVNPKGIVVDLSWPQVRQFCNERDLKHVVDLWEGPHGAFVVDDFIDKRFAEDFGKGLSLGSDKKLVDEGVCVRWDGLTPTILKCKSPTFLAHETRLLDKDVLDIEADQSEAAG